MPQLEKSEIKDRAARLRAAGEVALASYLAGLVGRDIEVLVEQGAAGRSEHYTRVRLDGEHTAGAEK